MWSVCSTLHCKIFSFTSASSAPPICFSRSSSGADLHEHALSPFLRPKLVCIVWPWNLWNGRLALPFCFEFNVTCRWILKFYLALLYWPHYPSRYKIVSGYDLFPVHNWDLFHISYLSYFNDYLIDSSWSCSINLCTSKWKLLVVTG